MVNGTPQIPMVGTSMMYGFDDGKAKGMIGLTENACINVKNKSKTIPAELDVPQSGGNGAVIGLMWSTT